MIKSDKHQEMKDNPPQPLTCQSHFNFEYEVCICSLCTSRCKLVIEPFDNPNSRNITYSHNEVYNAFLAW